MFVRFDIIEAVEGELFQYSWNHRNYLGMYTDLIRSKCHVVEKYLRFIITIYYQGRLVVDLTAGWFDQVKTKLHKRETLPLVFSTTKDVVAANVAFSVQRGWLGYSALVTKY